MDRTEMQWVIEVIARTHEIPWREWQVDTNQISRTEYNSE